MENDGDEIRFVGKRFKCHNCMTKFTKLVKLDENSTTCEKCQNVSFEISEEEYKRKTRTDIDQAPRFIFTKSTDKKQKEENKSANNSNNSSARNQTNGYTSNGNQPNSNQNRNNNFNIYSNSYTTFGNTEPFTASANRSRSQFNNNNNNQHEARGFNIFSENPFSGGFGIFPNFSQQQSRPVDFRNDFFGGLFPFLSSPFTNNVNRHNFHGDVFDPIFEIFGTSFNSAFQDNFSSNFRSNLFNNNFINIIIQESFQNAQANKKPPVAKEAIERLNKFKMNEKYCKKNDKGEMEQPTCSVCLCEIKMEEETILVPCGHLYHSSCILKWFDTNNSCPVCRFELPPEKA